MEPDTTQLHQDRKAKATESRLGCRMGSGLARLFARANYTVLLGSRDLNKASVGRTNRERESLPNEVLSE